MNELLILGLLHNNELHGYQLKQIADRLTYGFYKISYSTLYPKFKKLENNLYIKSKTIITEGGQERVYYQITENGKDYFIVLMETLQAKFFKDSWDIFKIKMLFFNLIGHEQQKLIIKKIKYEAGKCINCCCRKIFENSSF